MISPFDGQMGRKPQVMRRVANRSTFLPLHTGPSMVSIATCIPSLWAGGLAVRRALAISVSRR